MKKKDEQRKIHTEGGAYYEAVHVENGDFVGGSKVIQGGDGSIVAGTINASEITLNNGAVSAGISLADLKHLLEQYHAAVQTLPLPKEEQAVIAADFKVVETQLASPEPKKHLLLPKLKSILEVVTAAGAASEALPKIIPLGEKVIEWVKALL